MQPTKHISELAKQADEQRAKALDQFRAYVVVAGVTLVALIVMILGATWPLNGGEIIGSVVLALAFGWNAILAVRWWNIYLVWNAQADEVADIISQYGIPPTIPRLIALPDPVDEAYLEAVAITAEDVCQPDCIERATCPIVGVPGHYQCGTCEEHGEPRHHCGCMVATL